jgi:hypothetical protein
VEILLSRSDKLSTDTNRLLDDAFQLLRHPRMWRNQTDFLSLFERAVGGFGACRSTSEGCDLALSEKGRRKDDDIDRYSLSTRQLTRAIGYMHLQQNINY